MTAGPELRWTVDTLWSSKPGVLAWRAGTSAPSADCSEGASADGDPLRSMALKLSVNRTEPSELFVRDHPSGIFTVKGPGVNVNATNTWLSGMSPAELMSELFEPVDELERLLGAPEEPDRGVRRRRPPPAARTCGDDEDSEKQAGDDAGGTHHAANLRT